MRSRETPRVASPARLAQRVLDAPRRVGDEAVGVEPEDVVVPRRRVLTAVVGGIVVAAAVVLLVVLVLAAAAAVVVARPRAPPQRPPPLLKQPAQRDDLAPVRAQAGARVMRRIIEVVGIAVARGVRAIRREEWPVRVLVVGRRPLQKRDPRPPVGVVCGAATVVRRAVRPIATGNAQLLGDEEEESDRGGAMHHGSLKVHLFHDR